MSVWRYMLSNKQLKTIETLENKSLRLIENLTNNTMQGHKSTVF